MKEHLDNVVVNWLTEEGIPFHIVRSVAFREMLTSFLKVSVRGTTTYTPPRERRLTGIARKKYGDQAARVKEWIAKGCKTASISVDGTSCIHLNLLIIQQVGLHLLVCHIGVSSYISLTSLHLNQ